MKKKILSGLFAVLFIAIIVLAAVFNDPVIDDVFKDTKENHYIVVLQGINVVVEYVPESWTEEDHYKFVQGEYKIDREEGFSKINNQQNYIISLNDKKVKVLGKDIIDAIKRL